MLNKKIKVIIIALIVTNVLTAVLLIDWTIKAQKQKKLQSVSELKVKTEYSFRDNIKYIEKLSLYSVYKKHAEIVMLGNSITSRVDWSELLDRNDIVNRGIDSDITEGYLNRMETIYSVNPRICFLMGGINDIAKNISPDTTIRNITQITAELKLHGIIPVMQSVLYVADTYPDYLKMNNAVSYLNTRLERVAAENNIRFLDLNRVLSSEKKLIKGYALNDGIHLTGSGYKMWGTILSECLSEYGL
jgi:lysophospholipase L1-like esterase